jgi:hypothetical protein
MKIDKIVFSSSVHYSQFWNIQSRVWKTKFNIEPVCLLFGGTKKECRMSEEFGTVHEIPFDPSLPDIIQLQFYKYYFPHTEPEKVWMIGDIDQVPLQTEHFLEGLEGVSDNAYCHLNHSLCAQIHNVPRHECIVDGKPIFLQKGGFSTGGYDLPGHHHIAKGRIMKQLFFPDKPFVDTMKDIVESRRYGMIKPWNGQIPQIHGEFWCADEWYTSEKIWYGYQNQNVFDSMFFKDYHIWNNKICRSGNLRNQYGQWIPQWNGTDYIYDPAKVKDKTYVEIHCHRGYYEQESALMKLLKLAEMI